MNAPERYLVRMAVFLLAVAGVLSTLYSSLQEAFLANPGLNGLILGVMVMGIGYIFGQVFVVRRAEGWIDQYRTDLPGRPLQKPPGLLAPMAAMLGERSGGRLRLSAMSLRSLLDGIESRLEESRDLSRYLIGLLIFLGLLGTFWGLLQTITAVGDVIGGLSVSSGDAAAVFANLQSGLQAPLSGMGTAFSSSLFGLAGSLILGFLELQAGQAQNRLYNDLEEWLAGQTRLSSGSLSVGEGDQGVPAYVQALLEQSADSLENLQRTLERGEEGRITANHSIVNLTDKLGTLTDQMRTEQSLMIKLAETQLEIKPLLAKLADDAFSQMNAFDESTRGSIRNIDTQLSRLIEELATGRHEAVSEIRSEIRVLSRTLAAIDERRHQ